MADQITGTKTCFITAPSRVDTSAIRRVLRRHGFGTRDVADVRPGDSLAERVQNEIAKADVIVAVFSGPKPSAGVTFEAGLALGLGKPVIVVASEPVESPFSPLASAPIVLADPANEDALTFSFAQILPALERTPSRRAPRKRKAQDKPGLVEGFAAHIEALRASGNERQLERLLLEVFKEDPGVSVTVEKKVVGAEIDMAIWLDGYDSILGNPLIVELKLGALSEDRLRRSEFQLYRLLRASIAKFGLLIYLDRRARRFVGPGVSAPNIVRFEASDLVTELSKASLGRTILAERNRLVHSRSP